MKPVVANHTAQEKKSTGKTVYKALKMLKQNIENIEILKILKY